MRRGKTRPATLIVAERRAYVFRLKQAGASYAEITRTMHADLTWSGRLPRRYTERDVHRDVSTELQRYRSELAEMVEDVRQEELLRLNRLLLAYWSRALGDANRPGDLDAARFIVQVMERRARYLPGLNAPLPIAPVTPDGTAPYAPDATPPEQFFTELAVLFQQLAPLHIAAPPERALLTNGYSSSSAGPSDLPGADASAPEAQ